MENPLKGKNIKAVQKQIEEVFGKLKDETTKLAEEVKRIHTPLNKKVININGKGCFISLIEDGRVMIQFDNITSAEEYFKEPPVYSESSFKEHGKNCAKSGMKIGKENAESMWKKAKWYHRLWWNKSYLSVTDEEIEKIG